MKTDQRRRCATCRRVIRPTDEAFIACVDGVRRLMDLNCGSQCVGAIRLGPLVPATRTDVPPKPIAIGPDAVWAMILARDAALEAERIEEEERAKEMREWERADKICRRPDRRKVEAEIRRLKRLLK